MRFIAALPIHLYRWSLKPFLGHWCRFEPSCSDYALQAIRSHGALKGWWLALKRLSRCRPGGGHGYDPVPGRSLRRSLRVPNNAGSGTHEIVFYDTGPANAKRTVICVHGLTRNAHDFDLLARHLAQRGVRVLALSMAGRGESAWLEDASGYNNVSYAQDCLAVLDHLGIDQADWVGTSMGGLIGMLIASQHPGRINKMVLNDIGMIVKKEALQRIFSYVCATPPHFPSRDEADAYMRSIYAPFGIIGLPVWQDFVDHSLLKKDGGYILACDPAIMEPVRIATDNFTTIQDADLSALWAAISIPVLIIRGALSDILDTETVAVMCAANPRAESVTIAGVGHAPALMTEDQMVLVADWLLKPDLASARDLY